MLCKRCGSRVFILAASFSFLFFVISTLSLAAWESIVPNNCVPVQHGQLLSSALSVATLYQYAQALSPEQKAAQVLMISVSGKNELSDTSVRQLHGTVPGAVIFFGYNIADTASEMTAFIQSCTAKLKEGMFRLYRNDVCGESIQDVWKGSENSAACSVYRTCSRRPVFVPPLYAVDNEGGHVYRTRKLTGSLPAAQTVAQRYTAAQAELLYHQLGVQMRNLGLHLNLAPVAEPLTTENASVLDNRSFGKDPSAVGVYVAAAVRGMQSAGICSALKHFPGNGNSDLHNGGAVLPVSIDMLHTVYANPFRAGIAAGAVVVLVSHVTVSCVEATPFCFSKKGIDMLRRQYGFNGIVLTDDIAMEALVQNGASAADNAIRALSAGCDMVLCSEQKIYPVIKILADKARTDAAFSRRLTDAVAHILTVKQQVGLLDLP